MAKTVRLNKVLKELNISLDRAVEHLNAHGFDVVARPTTKLSEEEYDSLCDAFSTDRQRRKASAEVSEEKKKELNLIFLVPVGIKAFESNSTEKSDFISSKTSSGRKSIFSQSGIRS